MEALRWISYLKTGGKMIINDFEIPSAPILMGNADYPAGILDDLKGKADLTVFEAGKIAGELGNSKAMNIVLLGAMTKALNMNDIDWKKAITANVKKDFIKLNLEAFSAGEKLV